MDNFKAGKNEKSHLTEASRRLRQGMTPEERKLWYCFLKKLDVTVNRQKTFGRYIADFYCHAAKTVIELDGSRHFTDEGKKYDSIRDDYFAHRGIKVLRYTDNEVNNDFSYVCEDILRHIKGEKT